MIVPRPSHEMSPVQALDTLCAQVGEGVAWDMARNGAWWVDIWGNLLFFTGRAGTQAWRTPEMPSGALPTRRGTVLVPMVTALFEFDPDAGTFTVRGAPPDLPPTHRFNDMTVDGAGRLLVASMQRSDLGAEPTGTLYAWDGEGWRSLRTGFTTLNGLAFSPDGRRLYLSDSAPGINRIWHAEYDVAAGLFGPLVPFVDMAYHRGRPDGAATDEEGGYWIAAVGGACLHRFLPDGDLDRTIELPVDHPTKPAFGGPDLTDLYVTSLSIRPSDPLRMRDAGRLHRVRTGFRGHRLPVAVA